MNIFLSYVWFYLICVAAHALLPMNKDALTLKNESEKRDVSLVTNTVTRSFSDYDLRHYWLTPRAETKELFRKCSSTTSCYNDALKYAWQLNQDDPEVQCFYSKYYMSKGNVEQGLTFLQKSRESRLLKFGYDLERKSYFKTYVVYKKEIHQKKDTSKLPGATSSFSSSLVTSPAATSPESLPKKEEAKAFVSLSASIKDAIDKNNFDVSAITQHGDSGNLLEAYYDLTEEQQKTPIGIQVKKAADTLFKKTREDNQRKKGNFSPVLSRSSAKLLESKQHHKNTVSTKQLSTNTNKAKIDSNSVGSAAFQSNVEQGAVNTQLPNVSQLAPTENAIVFYKNNNQDNSKAEKTTISGVNVSCGKEILCDTAAQSEKKETIVQQADPVFQARMQMDSLKEKLHKQSILSPEQLFKLIQYSRDDDIDYPLMYADADALSLTLQQSLGSNPWEIARILYYLDSEKNAVTLSTITQLHEIKHFDKETLSYLQGLCFMREKDSVFDALKQFEAIVSQGKRIEAVPYLFNCYRKQADGQNALDPKALECLNELIQYSEETVRLKKEGTVTESRLELTRQLAYEVVFSQLPINPAQSELIRSQTLYLTGLYLSLTQPVNRKEVVGRYCSAFFNMLMQPKSVAIDPAKLSTCIEALQGDTTNQRSCMGDLILFELKRRESLANNIGNPEAHLNWLKNQEAILCKLKEDVLFAQEGNNSLAVAFFVQNQYIADCLRIAQKANQLLVNSEFDRALGLYRNMPMYHAPTFIKACIGAANLYYIKKNTDGFIASLLPAADLMLKEGCRLSMLEVDRNSLIAFYKNTHTDDSLKKIVNTKKDKKAYIHYVFDLFCGEDRDSSTMQYVDPFVESLKQAEKDKDAFSQIRITLTALYWLVHQNEKMQISIPKQNRFSELCSKVSVLALNDPDSKQLIKKSLDALHSQITIEKSHTSKTSKNLREQVGEVLKKLN